MANRAWGFFNLKDNVYFGRGLSSEVWCCQFVWVCECGVGGMGGQEGDKVCGMFLILFSSCFHFSAKAEGEGKSTSWPFVCLALSHADLIMALTFSLLFTYHVKAVPCQRLWAEHAAPSIILLFIAQAVASVLFTFAPDAWSILSFLLFFPTSRHF